MHEYSDKLTFLFPNQVLKNTLTLKGIFKFIHNEKSLFNTRPFIHCFGLQE